MALGLRSELRDEQGDADRPDHRDQDNPDAPRRRRREDVRVVPERDAAFEEQVVDQADQVPERHRADARDHAQDEGQQRQLEQA